LIYRNTVCATKVISQSHIMQSGNHDILTLRPTRAEISLAAMRHNVEFVRSIVGKKKILAVVKSNGYGHGMIESATAFTKAGVDYLGVACIEEGIALRNAAIKLPILVFGGLLEAQLALYLKHYIEITASSPSKIEQIDQAAKAVGHRARIHLKIDTGLERIGVHYYSAAGLFEAALNAKHCDVVGVYSHFADVKANDLTLSKLQLERFLAAIDYYTVRAKTPVIRHIAASGGVLHFPESYLDMVRPGLMLYGVTPEAGGIPHPHLMPAMALKSKIVYFKVVKSGAGVSYGHRWHAPTDTRIVTVPIGYGDGYTRQFSNVAPALIRGKRYQVVGSVCMDQLMVDIGQGEGFNGDDVVLFGRQAAELISVEELAGLINTTPHEVLVLLNQRVPRIYAE